MNKFIGQWIGTSMSGSFTLVNIAQNDVNIFGRVSLFETVNLDGEPFSYWTWSYLEGTLDNKNILSGRIHPPSIHNLHGEALSNEDLAYLKDKSGLEFPTNTTFNAIKLNDFNLEVEWNSTYVSEVARHDKIILSKEDSNDSKIIHEQMSWNRFKEFASSQKDGLIYRGQARNWRLRTSFHRTGHADIVDYLDFKIPEVEHHINAYSNYVYNINDNRSFGALLNLAQHHGYPTPLLDWSKSPYVAAFFAFQDETLLKKDGSISIFIFDDFEWRKMTGWLVAYKLPNMVVRTIELPGFGNSRVLPQQATFMYSNVDDIEYILQRNEKTPGQFLRAISIPASERDIVMRDLNLMGITWGSMFPGLDGICKQLNSRHFS